jgi:hypothetical protein
MSIIASKTVRSSIAIAFTLSAIFVWGHERSVKTNQTQLADSSAKECYFANGEWVCPN